MTTAVVDLSLLYPILERYRGQQDALITMLQEMQDVYAYLPEDALERLSRETRIPLSRIYAVATFYSQFYLTPRGRNMVRICVGTACHVRGGSRILEALEREMGIAEGETSPDLEYSLETVACIGACALAPTVVVNKNTYGKLTPAKVQDIFGRKSKKEPAVE